MQRPWGRTLPGLLDEESGGPRDCSTVRCPGKREGHGGNGPVLQGLGGLGEDLGFFPMNRETRQKDQQAQCPPLHADARPHAAAQAGTDASRRDGGGAVRGPPDPSRPLPAS